MRKLYPVPPEPSTDPVDLAAAVQSLIPPLPAGTACCMGIVLLVMRTGRLVQTPGSLARAVLPFVVHRRWGGHRVERAMEWGPCTLDALLERAAAWCLAPLPGEPGRLGCAHREGHALDSSTSARLRAGKRLAGAGTGSCHRAGRAVRAHSVAALTAVVMMRGGRVGLGRRPRFGPSCPDAVARVVAARPPPTAHRLLVGEAGRATQAQVAAAPEQDAWRGRGRLTVKLRGAPAPRPGTRGRPPGHGAGRHPGRAPAEGAPEVEQYIPGAAGRIRIRRGPLLP